MAPRRDQGKRTRQGKEKAGSSRAPPRVEPQSPEMGMLERDISLKDSNARDKDEELFKNRVAHENGSVDSAYLNSVWPVVCKLFKGQDWKEAIIQNHPYYINVVHSVFSNTHVLKNKYAMS